MQTLLLVFSEHCLRRGIVPANAKKANPETAQDISSPVKGQLRKRIASLSGDLEDMLCRKATKIVLAENLDEEIEF
jgi:hypothetical protein